ncbi:hypothetical protein M3216_19940 [Paenibacillus macerans]|nr:hypothetical protein [Paenibacillus macerans]
MGIQFVEAENNVIRNNDFVANVIEAEATDSTVNQMERNFWDSARVLDLNGDGIQSPGIGFLSGMYENSRENWTTDSAQSMHLNNTPAVAADSSTENHKYISDQTFMLIVASLMFLTSIITIIYSGGTKS